MKGVELPINILVIVAIAIIVLLALVALYFTGSQPFSGFISVASLKNQGCSNFSYNYDCGKRGATTADVCLPANSYLTGACSAAGDTASNLKTLCKMKFNAPTEADCKALCGC